MQIAEAPVRDVRPLFAGERADLLALLASLGNADWATAGPSHLVQPLLAVRGIIV